MIKRRAIGSEELKYGQRCSVVAIPCAPMLTSAGALELVGPQAFGLAEVYEPGKVGEYANCDTNASCFRNFLLKIQR